MHSNSFFKEFFNYSKSEKRGLIVLIIILVLVIAIRWIIHEPIDEIILTRIEDYNNSEFSTIDERPTSSSRYISHSKKSTIGRINPNTATAALLLKVGLTSEVVSNIIEYRNKGGVFASKNDLLQVNGIDTLVLATIQASLFDTFYYYKKPEKANLITRSNKIDLNKADSVEFTNLPGIGPVLSMRVLKYRNLLGGFYSTQQLSEVYGISDSLVATIESCLVVDSSEVIKININNSSFKTLIKHPYLNRHHVKAIQSYVKHIGAFTSTKQLVDNYLVSDEVYGKIQPYLRLN